MRHNKVFYWIFVYCLNLFLFSDLALAMPRKPLTNEARRSLVAQGQLVRLPSRIFEQAFLRNTQSGRMMLDIPASANQQQKFAINNLTTLDIRNIDLDFRNVDLVQKSDQKKILLIPVYFDSYFQGSLGLNATHNVAAEIKVVFAQNTIISYQLQKIQLSQMVEGVVEDHLLNFDESSGDESYTQDAWARNVLIPSVVNIFNNSGQEFWHWFYKVLQRYH